MICSLGNCLNGRLTDICRDKLISKQFLEVIYFKFYVISS